MDITLNEKSVRQMAARIRKALGGNEALSHSKALETVAQSFGYPNWDTLSGMLKKEARTQFKLDKPVKLFIDAFVCDEWGSGPSWACVEVDQKFIDMLLDMQHVCKTKNMEDVSRDASPMWEGEDEHRMENDQLIVGHHRWWLRANSRHCDYAVETRSIDVEWLLDALSTGASNDFLHWRKDVLLYDPSGNSSGFVDMLIEAGELDESYADV